MPTTFTTNYLGLVIPVNLQDPSPQWGLDLYNAWIKIDQLLGTGGSGIVVGASNININGDLTFAGFNATNFRSVRFNSQGAPLSVGTDIGCLYEVLGDLYYNDSSGNQIRFTKNGAINIAALSYLLKTGVSGNYTILSTDQFNLYYVNTTSVAATINLPSSSLMTPGRFFLFTDINRNSETNSITLVPNGADTINGFNSNFVIQFNGTTCLITTDGYGKWYAQDEGATYLRAGGLSYTGTFYVNGTTGINLQYNGTTQLAVNTASVAINTTLNFPNSPATIQVAGVTQETITSSLITLTPPTLQWGAAVTAPAINQAANASSAGQALTITAQAAGGSNNAGGNLVLSSGAHTGSGFDGYVLLQTNGTTQAFVAPIESGSMSQGGLGIGSSPGTSPTITSGTGVPSTTEPNGSIFMRTDGTTSSGMYLRQSGAWSPIALGLSAIVSGTTHTITTTYTVDSSQNDYFIYLNHSSAFNLILPAPSLGRVIVVKDITGAMETNPVTLVRHGSENINGIAASRVLQANWGCWTISSPDGSSWVTASS